MELPIYQIDAFTNQAFAGNPAAVCPLQYWLDDALMQSIAAENNLSETAFFVKEGAGYRIRWFTPKCEVNLCGHATLASALVLWQEMGVTSQTLVFDSASGPLHVSRDGTWLVLDFPSRPINQTLDDAKLLQAFACDKPIWLGADAGRVLLHLASEPELAQLAPDFQALKHLPYEVYYVTAKGDDIDFVARVFAPLKGINEDPVTGSAYTALTPYWARQLARSRLHARQISARGGELFTTDKGARVHIAGQAVCVLRGNLLIPAI